MIFSCYIIDSDNGVLLVEKAFQSLKISKLPQDSVEKSLTSGVIAEFFSAINTFIDEIQAAMRKGRDISNMNRTLLAENSTVTLHYHPEARVLVGAISDPDDDVDIIMSALGKIGERFWQKHRQTLENFRATLDKGSFKAFIPDIELILRDGKIAELFPKLELDIKTLHRITLMGVISKDEYAVGALLDGKTMSPLSVAKKLGRSKAEVMDVLKKLESLDIIKAMKLPKF